MTDVPIAVDVSHGFARAFAAPHGAIRCHGEESGKRPFGQWGRDDARADLLAGCWRTGRIRTAGDEEADHKERAELPTHLLLVATAPPFVTLLPDR